MEPDEKLYFMIRDAIDVFARLNNRMEVFGEENVPVHGGALLCPNHENFSDPFFVGAAVRGRLLHFLAWHGIEEMPLIGPMLKRVGTMHPIKECYGNALDKDEVRNVLGDLDKLLQAGELCAIFPEGTIKHWIGPGDMHEFKPGAVRLAARAGVPIIPVGLWGSRWVVPNIYNPHDFGGPDIGYWIPMALPAKVRVGFGARFHVAPAAATDRSTAESETLRLRKTIIALVETLRPKSLLKYIL